MSDTSPGLHGPMHCMHVLTGMPPRPDLVPQPAMLSTEESFMEESSYDFSPVPEKAGRYDLQAEGCS